MLKTVTGKENSRKGYCMKKRVWGIVMAGLLLMGCQNMGNEQIQTTQAQSTQTQPDQSDFGEEQENGQQLKNGDHISLSLGSQVSIDAVVEMSDKNWNGIEKCTAKMDGFQGEKIFEELFGKIPEDGVKKEEGYEGTPAFNYSYEGTLGEKLRNQNGTIRVSSGLNLETEEGKKIYSNLPVEYISAGNGEGIMIYGGEQEVTLENEEDLIAQCQQFIEQVGGWEQASLTDAYGFSYEQMEQQQEASIQAEENGELLKPQEIEEYEWSEADNCKLLFFQSYLNGIPVLCNEVNRQDELFIPATKIRAVITKEGIEYLSADGHFAVQEKETISLAGKDTVMETLKNKFDLTSADPVTLDRMKLIYYPITTGRDEDGFLTCDMIPAWQFRYVVEDISMYVYINAADGSEIVG